MLHKIYLIAKREFISRVKKKSFLVMTLLSPILILLFYGLIFYFSFNKDLTEEVKTIIISDHAGILKEKLEPTKTIQFEFNNGLEESQASIEIDEREAYAVLFIKKSEKGISYELIGKEQARAEGKPEEMLEKIALGKLNKFYKDFTLLNQDLVKDPSKNIRQLLADTSKTLSVSEFKRIAIGS
jgi:translation elongation factor EF-Ts